MAIVTTGAKPLSISTNETDKNLREGRASVKMGSLPRVAKGGDAVGQRFSRWAGVGLAAASSIER
jgi:hypothetical protein